MAKVAKRATRTRRRDRKNVEKARRISARPLIIQSLQLQIQPEMQFHGQAQAA